MDQVKVFLLQCVKYRFWIAFGISLLLPLIGYFVGASTINDETVKQEAAIKKSDGDVKKYTTPGVINDQYAPEVTKKKDVLVTDVDTAWRKLYAQQEPLMKWPPVVEARFKAWGPKWPENVDRGAVQRAITDYTFAYRDFVDEVYKTLKPWNPEDGKGIVFAPDANGLIHPAGFNDQSPPELDKIWSEQQRLWVVTAVLDVIAKVNDSVGAKDWDTAIIKQLSDLDVGSYNARDQVATSKDEQLEPMAPILPPGATAPAAAEPAGGFQGGIPAGGGPPGGSSSSRDVLFLKKPEATAYQILPIRMTVLIDQNRIPDLLVALENSPMAITVMEVEMAKPGSPVTKPVYGDRMRGSGGMGYGMGGQGGDETMSLRGGGGRVGGGKRNEGGGMEGMMMNMPGAGRGGASAAVSKSGTDARGVNKAADRKKAEKEAAKKKEASKVKLDQYYNIVELIVYGQARFYNPPPAPTPTAETPSTAAQPAPAPAQPAPGQPSPLTPGVPPATAPAPAPAAGTTPAPAPAPAPALAPGAPGDPAKPADAPKADAKPADAPAPGAAPKG
jgi:hypothetical protein